MSDVEAMYHRIIMERARQPRYQRRLDPFDHEVRETNPLCGDRVTLRLRCDAAGRATAIGYEARACAICIASADLAAEVGLGLSAEEAASCAAALDRALESGATDAWTGRLAPFQVFAPLHEARSRIRCALLPWEGLIHALTLGVSADAS